MNRIISTITLFFLIYSSVGQQCVCGTNINLIRNGGFESGQFESESEMLPYSPGIVGVEYGWYAVTESASNIGGQFGGSPQSGNYFLMIDGEDFSLGNVPVVAWRQTVDCLIPGNNYSFKFYVRGLSGFGELALLDATVTVNGVKTVLNSNWINTFMPNPNTPLNWLQYPYTWTATSSQATFGLEQINFGGGTLDYGIDNIRLIGTSSMTLTSNTQSTPASCVEANNGEIQAQALSGTGPYHFNLSQNQLLISSQVQDGPVTFTGLAPATYEIEITDALGCSRSENIIVSQLSDMSFDLNLAEATCVQSAEVEITNIPGAAPFEFYIDEISNSGASAFLEEGQHQIRVVDANGCEGDTIINVNPLVQPVASFSGTTLNPDSAPLLELTNNSSDANAFEWNYNGVLFSQEFSPPNLFEEGVASVTLIAKDSLTFCTDTITKEFIIPGPNRVWIPNAITINSDGLNELFKVVISGAETAKYDLRIFNRWGQPVFESLNPDEVWIGEASKDGYYAQDGVYTYRLSVQFTNETMIKNYTGTISVLR